MQDFSPVCKPLATPTCKEPAQYADRLPNEQWRAMTGVLKLSMPKSLSALLVTTEIGLIKGHLEGKERKCSKETKNKRSLF